MWRLGTIPRQCLIPGSSAPSQERLDGGQGHGLKVEPRPCTQHFLCSAGSTERSEARQPGHCACNRGDTVYTTNPKGSGGRGRYNAMRINDEIKVFGKQKRDLRDQEGPRNWSWRQVLSERDPSSRAWQLKS